jgi:hypothetical protein
MLSRNPEGGGPVPTIVIRRFNRRIRGTPWFTAAAFDYRHNAMDSPDKPGSDDLFKTMA